MPLKPGTITQFSNSMAEAMETAFKQEWPMAMNDAPLPATSEQMKLLFVAIAQGVVKHLQENATSFKVEVDNGSGVELKGEVNEIE